MVCADRWNDDRIYVHVQNTNIEFLMEIGLSQAMSRSFGTRRVQCFRRWIIEV